MNIIKIMTLLTFVAFSTNIFAYGSGSSSKKSCEKPDLSQFTPPHLSVVAPESEFSFVASAATNPETIEVSMKKQIVETNIEKISGGYSVTGNLPASLEGAYVRVSIKAKGTNNCPENDGWLLKIEQ
ncbi:MAG: hypothetical protein L3J59_03290 [Methylococcaceae bacterium]|nr:hypothetical protein [Methylococcaceae bacterium]